MPLTPWNTAIKQLFMQQLRITWMHAISLIKTPGCAVVVALSVASLLLLLLMLTNGFSIVLTSMPWYIRVWTCTLATRYLALP